MPLCLGRLVSTVDPTVRYYGSEPSATHYDAITNYLEDTGPHMVLEEPDRATSGKNVELAGCHPIPPKNRMILGTTARSVGLQMAQSRFHPSLHPRQKPCKELGQTQTLTHTHTHTYIYIYMYIWYAFWDLVPQWTLTVPSGVYKHQIPPLASYASVLEALKQSWALDALLIGCQVIAWSCRSPKLPVHETHSPKALRTRLKTQ